MAVFAGFECFRTASVISLTQMMSWVRQTSRRGIFRTVSRYCEHTDTHIDMHDFLISWLYKQSSTVLQGVCVCEGEYWFSAPVSWL